MLFRIRNTRKVSRGEDIFLPAKDHPFQDLYIEAAVYPPSHRHQLARYLTTS